MNLNEAIPYGRAFASAGRTWTPRRFLHAAIGFGVVALCMLPAARMHAQGGQSVSAIPKPEGYIIPAANRPPDANDRMKMSDQRVRRESFDKANTERIHLIDDETAKLLLLTRDLKARMERLGKGPYPPEVAKEMEAIEVLAHDVQEKMKLTIGGS